MSALRLPLLALGLALTLFACDDDASIPPGDAGPDAPVITDGTPDGPPTGETAPDGPVGDGQPADTLPPDTGPKPPAQWDPLPPMTQARAFHTATTLQDGTLLVVGGIDSYNGLDSAERYDPKTNAWSAAGTMSGAHWAHTATLLLDGRVLVVGGCADGPSNVCMLGVGVDLYDPKAAAGSQWTTAASMLAARRSHCAARLADGRVFVAGGFDNQKDHTGVEIYDPQTGFWSSPTAKLAAPRNLATATTLTSGKVLLAGGYSGTQFLDTLELFDPTNNTIQLLGAKLIEARAMHTATLLNDGKVLIVGGFCDDTGNPSCAVSDAEIYDPTTGKVVAAGSPGTKTTQHRATLLGNGEVLITGGLLTAKDAKLFTGSAWAQTVPMANEHYNHAAALVGSKVIVTGGSGSGTWYGSTAAEIYTP